MISSTGYGIQQVKAEDIAGILEAEGGRGHGNRSRWSLERNYEFGLFVETI